MTILLFIFTVYIIGYFIILVSFATDNLDSFNHNQRLFLNSGWGMLMVAVIMAFYPAWLFIGSVYGLIKSFKQVLTTAENAV